MSKGYIDRYSRTKNEFDSDTLDAIQYQREIFEKYVTRNNDRADERASLLRSYENGEPLFGPKGLRRELASFDLQYFGMAYLPHYYITSPPPFHDELDRIWIQGVLKGLNVLTDPKQVNRQEGCRQVIAAPRGHAKSTTITFKDPLHAIIYQYKHYILILSDSSDQAESFLEDIRSELEDIPYVYKRRFRRPQGRQVLEKLRFPDVDKYQGRGNRFRQKDSRTPSQAMAARLDPVGRC